jgi:hypothetical protein
LSLTLRKCNHGKTTLSFRVFCDPKCIQC